MDRIKNIEKLANVYKNWQASDIAFIKELYWSMRYVRMIVYCQPRETGVEWPRMSNIFFELSLKFKNVAALKVDFKSDELQQILGLDILDVSNRHMENINFQIEDYENGVISFFCESIEVDEVIGAINL